MSFGIPEVLSVAHMLHGVQGSLAGDAQGNEDGIRDLDQIHSYFKPSWFGIHVVDSSVLK